ncbi:SHIRT domain-containing protein [Schaalia sp. lx-260]|uniref:SHIRT domain-containing protein n=1 Tax=Schaalia sp. lx-260 TaxID=2899082 RepID=UPI001E471233|nr:SHIRT domain-containing protein [Schaalia sp. lx-260]MCD4549859.1 SHIRT domain-containing protein [Schaalia sp. lx-260]
MRNLRQAVAAGTAALMACSGLLLFSVAANADDNNVIAPTNAEPINPAGRNDIKDHKGILAGDPEDKLFPSLVCVPAKDTYAIDYRGTLDMKSVIDAWNSKKEKGRQAFVTQISGSGIGAYLPRVFGTSDVNQSYNKIFSDLLVRGEFHISMKIDPAVVSVNQTVLVDTAAWDAAYRAANTDTQYPNHMVIDTAKPPTYAEDGTLTIHFKLADGLHAEDLDNDYKTLKTLAIDTPANLFTVSKENFRNLEAAARSFDLTVPLVQGTFEKPTLDTTRNAYYAVAQPFADAVMAPEFPVKFKQEKYNAATIRSISKVQAIHHFESDVPGQALPAEVTALLPAPSEALFSMAAMMPSADNATTPYKPADPAQTRVETADGVWNFASWGKLSEWNWNDDTAVSPECRVANVTGYWHFSEKPKSEVLDFELMCPAGDELPADTDKVSYKWDGEGKDRKLVATAKAGFVFAGGKTEMSMSCPMPEKEMKEPKPEKDMKEPTPEKDMKKPEPTKGKGGKQLATTGTTALLLGGSAATLITAGAGVLILRRRQA